MTAVLSYVERDPSDRKFGSTVFLGDLLLSSTSDRSDLLVPTIGPVSSIFPDGSGYVPVGFSQKLVTFGCVFAAGWSGPLVAARALFKGLYDEHRADGLNEATIKRHLEQLDES